MAPYSRYSGSSERPQMIGVYTEEYQTIVGYYQQQLQANQTQREAGKLKTNSAELKQQTEHYKKGGAMNRPINFSIFFMSDYTCIEHDKLRCEECLEKMIRSKDTSLSLVASSMIAGDNGFESEQQKLTAEESLGRQLRFVKKALNMGDPALKKKKIKDLPDLIKKAQDEITIGGMQELLTEDNRDARGILKGIARFFLKMGEKN